MLHDIPQHQINSCKPTSIRLTGAQQGKEGKEKGKVSQVKEMERAVREWFPTRGINATRKGEGRRV
jgi:hypothetical protein